jgi:glycosyltransferase involved in cell wall biosynthesis
MAEEILKGGCRTIKIKDAPLISIIIVTLNAEDHLKSCLDSIHQQSFQNFELLLFDGESTDGTLSILQEYNSYINYWQSEPDHGIYNAMNKAVTFAKGKWIYFLGADDRLLEGFSKMAEQLKQENTLYYGNCVANGKILGGKLSKYQVAKRNVCHQAVFYPARVFDKYTYLEKYRIYADHALNIQCWSDTELIKKYFNLSIAIYNLNGFSSQASDELFRAEKPLVIKSNLGSIVYYRYLFKKWREKRKKSDFF